MSFVQQVVEDPRWAEQVGDNPRAIAQARDRLWKNWVQGDEGRLEALAQMDPADRERMRAEFDDRAYEIAPNAFSVVTGAETVRQRMREPGPHIPFTMPRERVVERRQETRRPVYDAVTEEFIERAGKDPAGLKWSEFDQDELEGVTALLLQAYPDRANEFLANARERGRDILRERGAVLFPEGDEPGSAAKTFLHEATRRGLAVAEGAGAGPLTDLATLGLTAIRDMFDRDMPVGRALITGASPEARDVMNRWNALSADNRRLNELVYGDDTVIQQAAGTGLAWLGGANAIFRGNLRGRLAPMRDEAGRKILTRGGDVAVRRDLSFAIDPLTRRGLATGLGVDAAVGAAFGPEYAPSFMAQAIGIDPNRLTSAVESGAIGLAAGTVLRAISNQRMLTRMRRMPQFEDLADLPNREFARRAVDRLQEMWEQARRRAAQEAGGTPGAPRETAAAQTAPAARLGPAATEAPPVARAAPEPPPAPPAVMPGDEIQITVQQPQGRVPGYVQVDSIRAGENIRSGSIEGFRREGIDVPDVPDWVPQGRYTLEELREVLERGPRAARGSIADDSLQPPAVAREPVPGRPEDGVPASRTVRVSAEEALSRWRQKGTVEAEGFRDAAIRERFGRELVGPALKVIEGEGWMSAGALAGRPEFASSADPGELARRAVRSVRDSLDVGYRRDYMETGDVFYALRGTEAGPGIVRSEELSQAVGGLDDLGTRAAFEAAFDEALRQRGRALPQKAPVEKRPVARRFRVPAREDGGEDILNAIEGLGGIRSPSTVKEAQNLAIFDGFRETFSRGPARLLVTSSQDANMPDQLLRELEDLGYRFDSTDELYAAVQAASAERATLRQAMREAEARDRFFDALYENRGRSATETGADPVEVDRLRVGEAFAVRGRRLDVEGIDPDTGAVSLRHEDFGTVEVTAGSVVYPDRASFRLAPHEEPVGAMPFTSERRGSGSAFDAAQPKAEGVPDWVRREGETRRGGRLIREIARGGRKPSASPRSVVDFVNDIVRVEMRRSRGQTSRRHPAHYRPMGHVTYTRRGMSQINFHEAGHGLKELVEARDPGFFQGIEWELRMLTKREGSMASADNAHEGVAEWLRLRIVDPAAVEGSDITRVIEGGVGQWFPDMASGIRDAARAWERFQRLPAADRWRQLNRDMSQTGALKPWNIRNVALGLAERGMMGVASGSPISALDRRIFREIMRGRDEMGKTRAEALKVARAARERTQALTRAHNMILSIGSEVINALQGKDALKGLRIIGPDGNFEVMSSRTWKEVMAMVPSGQWDDFQHAGWAHETLNRFRKDRLEYPGMRDGMGPEDLKEIVAGAEREIPKFHEARLAVQEYFDTLLYIKLAGGLKELDEVERMRRRVDYWPLPRVLWGGGAQPPRVRTKADGNIYSGDFRAHGSGEAIRDLLEVAEERTRDALTGYYWNRLGNLMVENLRALATDANLPHAAREIAGRVMQPMKLERRVAASLSREEGQQIVAEALNRQVAMEMGVPFEEFEGGIKPGDINLAWDFKEIWRAGPPKDYNIVSLLRNGERFFYQVDDPMLFHYFAASQSAGTLGRVAEWMITPAVQNWKRNITQSLAFAVFRNLPGDLANQVALNRGAISWVPGGATTLGLWNKFFRKYPQVFDQGLLLSRQEPGRVELVNQMRHSAPFRFMTEGLYVSRNPNPLVRWMATALQPANWMYPFFKTGDVVNLLTGGRHLAPLFEGATREGAAVFEKLRGMSDEAAKDAYWRVTGRFNEHPGLGDMETLSKTPGFFNPAMQAVRGAFQNLTDPDPAISGAAWFKIFAYIPAIFGAGAAVRYMTMSDEEADRERERPVEQRTNYYDVHGFQMRFPLGFEGMMASWSYNAVMDHLLERKKMDGDREARLYLNRVFSWEGPVSFLGPQVASITEAQMNWSRFFQRNIVSPWMTHLPAAEQARIDTPEFYKELGQWFDYSPDKLQYIIRGGISSQTDEVIRVLDDLAKGKPIQERADLPFVGRLFVRDPVGFGAQSVRDVMAVEELIDRMEHRLRAKGWSQIDNTSLHPPEELTDELRALQVQVQQARMLRRGLRQLQRQAEIANTYSELGDFVNERNMRRAMVEYAQNVLLHNRDNIEKIEEALEMSRDLQRADPEQFEQDVLMRRLGN